MTLSSNSTSRGSKKRILFVDDEQSILVGLELSLRRKRSVWDTEFACGGAVALLALAQKPFDIVVSDMRMPGMDGETLLRRVQQQYPGIVRIVLSGHADAHVARRMIHVAHQFLAKPCDRDTLCRTLERACALHEVLESPKLRAIVGGLGQLPAAPSVYAEVNRLMLEDEPPLIEIVRLIERDPALSAKVLQVVNSAFFTLPQGASSVERAVCALGTEPTRAIVVSLEVDKQRSERSGPASTSMLHEHAAASARIASALAPKPDREQAFLAGLLHSIGFLILRSNLPEEFERCVQAAARDKRPLATVEREHFGVSHAEIGAYLLGLWGFAPSVVDAVLNYLEPPAALAGDGLSAPSGGQLSRLLHVACGLAHELGRPCLAAHSLGPKVFPELGAHLPRWREIASGALCTGRNPVRA